MRDPADNPAAGRGPLSGLRVLEAVGPQAPLPLALAAGLAGRIAADLGAELVRLHPAVEPRVEDAFLHRGKRIEAVAPDRWQAAVATLVADVDAVICDHATGNALPRTERAVPVVLGMSRDTPLAGSELTVEARSGLLDMVGDPEREPLRLGGHQTAYAAGLSAYLGLAAALARRQAGEAAGPVRVNLLDVAVWLNWKTLGMAARTGTAPHRSGNLAEWIVVPCADGHAALVYRPDDWNRLREALGDPRLADPRFSTPADRVRHRGPLNALFADIFATLTRARVHELAIRHKLPLGPVSSPAELPGDRQMLARQLFRPAAAGNGHVPGLPVLWNGVRPGSSHAAPAFAARMGVRA